MSKIKLLWRVLCAIIQDWWCTRYGHKWDKASVIRRTAVDQCERCYTVRIRTTEPHTRDPWGKPQVETRRIK